MGRGKVQLKRIDDKIRRQVTFSKRRTGLMKKARELSVLCGVEVGLVIFSPKGRLYEFCSGESFGKLVERYQIHNDEEIGASKDAGGTDKKNNSEGSGLRTGANQSLKMIQSNLETQDIANLDIPKLTQLEEELDAVLRQTRSRKTQLMMETCTALIETEKQLKEDKLRLENEIAALKLKQQQGKDRAADEEPDQQSTFAANNNTTTTTNSCCSDDNVPTIKLHLFLSEKRKHNADTDTDQTN
ncbi:transcription factor CAULIFLOWER A-like [Pyrus ussuriensis x Pyrus communis]|uniref:Transcription factor CAULIFLOWER A-like n=1 Tax=Pyrus ussuriensis x Pyrus communis TaxID=2448454 RepID=A0A5N5I5B8_9ROSA|nr:truncated transcription factor CAULIFLOWER A [Pyrus x bretschneideri]XP_048424622.1 truncated transcription factor CAULIFLOWER A [Pyrus x bretschneideri]XP_048424623.1 truncated transcription factor CAULIFLOWER A [Pyrus x bretschneideri]KAB2635346.1 transcription factor CAULIFLOWER A-like [Pyrus ussuriensis x Pyrus communis]